MKSYTFSRYKIDVFPLIIFYLMFGILMSCENKSPQDPGNASSTIDSTSIRLLYISNKYGSFDIYSNDMSGKNEVRITESPGWEWYPQFHSPSQMICFNKQDTSGNFSISQMSISGEEVPFEDFNLPGIEVSFGSDMIAYSRSSDAGSKIVIGSYNNLSDTLAITTDRHYNGRMKISVDGSKVAYISDRTGSNEIFLYDVNKDFTTQLTDNNLREKYMSWSPDGNQLAFTMQKDTLPNDIFILDITTREIKQLSSTEINESEIAWSPDGRWIAYHASANETDDIFILEIETGLIRKISDSDGYHGEPSWMTISLIQ